MSKQAILFDRPTMRSLREPIEKSLLKLGEELGIKFRIGNGSMGVNKTNASFKLEMLSINVDGSVESKEANDFKMYATTYGLSPLDLGKTFMSNRGTIFKIIGFNTRARKRPIIAERITDKATFVFEPLAVKGYLAKVKK